MKKEHWKIEIIRNCLKVAKENNEKDSVTRDEIKDMERTIKFYHLGVEFTEKNIKNKIIDIEKIQKFIEETESVNSGGQKLSDFDKLCFVQEDLTKIVNDSIEELK